MQSFSIRTNVLLVIVLFCFAHVNISKAQSVDFGLTTGMNVSSHLKKFLFNDADISLQFSPDATTGFQGGFIVRKNFTQSFRLQLEPSVILLGAKYSEPFQLRGFEFETESRTKLLYIQLPLLFQLSTRPKSREVYGRKFSTTTYHLSGGAFGGYLPYARFTGTNTGEPIGISFQGDFINDVRSQYSEYDGGVIFGIGLERGTNKKIGFESRALYSVIDSGSMPTQFEPQNIAITFSIYYLF